MRFFLCLTLLTLLSSFASAQAVDIFGRITNQDNEPLSGATISLKDNQGVISDEKGNFYIQTQAEKSIKLTIRFIGYETIDTLLNTEDGIDVYLQVKMVAQFTELPNIEITSRIQNIFKDFKHHISDFTISNNQIYLIIQKGNTPYLCKANLNGSILQEYEMEGGYKKFYNSCMGGIILVSKNDCAELHNIDGHLMITNEFSIDYFNSYIIPCKLNSGESLVFKNISRHNKKIDYLKYKEGKKQSILYSVYDQNGEKVARSYYRDIIREYYKATKNIDIGDIDFGFGLERENVIVDGSWSGDLQDLVITNRIQEYLIQYQALGLKEVQSELFVVEGNTYILDILNQQIVLINVDDEKYSIIRPYQPNGKVNLITDFETESYFEINNKLYAIELEGNDLNIQPFKDIEYCYFTERTLLNDGVLYRLGRKSMDSVRKTIFRDVLKN